MLVRASDSGFWIVKSLLEVDVGLEETEDRSKNQEEFSLRRSDPATAAGPRRDTTPDKARRPRRRREVGGVLGGVARKESLF